MKTPRLAPLSHLVTGLFLVAASHTPQAAQIHIIHPTQKAASDIPISTAPTSTTAITTTDSPHCDFTPNPKQFAFFVTGYGGEDKSYTVRHNTFKKYQLSSDSQKLLNAHIEIDAFSIDTSHDLNNGNGGEWPAAFASLRNSNIINGLFKHFEEAGTITDITPNGLTLEVRMNAQTRTIPMAYRIDNGVLHANGQLDVLDFNGESAFAQLSAIATNAWHQGKSWSEVGLDFSVPVKEPHCL